MLLKLLVIVFDYLSSEHKMSILNTSTWYEMFIIS